MLAAACAMKARLAQANLAGGLILAALAALLPALLRELCLAGVAARLAGLLAPWAFLGAFAGSVSGSGRCRNLLGERPQFLLFCLLDAAGAGLAASLACVALLGYAGPLGALALALGAGVAPAAGRDMALGYEAACFSEPWQGAGVALAVMACEALILLMPQGATPLWAAAAGTVIVAVARLLYAAQRAP